jgi:hypothetical protein
LDKISTLGNLGNRDRDFLVEETKTSSVVWVVWVHLLGTLHGHLDRLLDPTP